MNETKERYRRKKCTLDELKYKQRVGTLLLMLCVAIFAFGQQKTVKGNITDEKNEPVIGATVRVKGASIGSITDVDGHFKVLVNDVSKSVLVVSYVGYETQEIPLNGKTIVKIVLQETANELQEIMVVGYGTQKKETLTGAIASVKTEALLKSPAAGVANSLAGQIPGLSSNAVSGQPGKEDPAIYIRGVGSLTEGASSPLILVDGVERSFFQMDPNEIESVTILKDASATAVFGVRGANGVVLVTTRRGEEGKAKIQVTSSVGLQQSTRQLELADSYTFATMYNEMCDNDHTARAFDDYAVTRFRLGDEPIMYPSVNWRDYLMKKTAIQTQHNVNISGGTKNVRYFLSAGFLWQDGLLKQFEGLDYNNKFQYTRYNYRGNLDIDLTSSTLLKLGLGGIVGVRNEPYTGNMNVFYLADISQPFISPGLVDGKLVRMDPGKYPGILMDATPSGLERIYGNGYDRSTSNTMNMDLTLTQKLDFITKGLSIEIKGAYNTSYTSIVKQHGSVEGYMPYYKSSLENPGMSYDDPNFDKSIVYKINPGKSNTPLDYNEDNNTRSRDWYLEASLRYNRKFGDHNVGAMLLYNQHKKYYPSSWTSIPTAYVGLVGRLTYDYKSKYIAEFDFGYNGSENFAPDKRFGAFPAGSVGYVLSEEKFMKKQHVVDYLKIRGSVGLVGNDNINNNRFLYLADGYEVDKIGSENEWHYPPFGYWFGLNNNSIYPGALETRIGNPNVTWEKALKSNVGLDVNFLDNRLRISADMFWENRKDILINRLTVPLFTALTSSILPVVNMGKVKNKGYEIDVKWNDNIQNLNYWVNGNVTYSKNKIIEQDEVEPNEPYLWRTGKPVGTVFGYVFDRFYQESDFNTDGTLKEGNADPLVPVYPGDCKYVDLNGDNVINTDDQKAIGNPTRPVYTFGLNYGVNYKGWSLTMNWIGVAERSLVLSDQFRMPFNGGSTGLLQYFVGDHWTKETAETATRPRFSAVSKINNSKQSTLYVMDGSYLKLKTVQIGYTFTGKPFLKKMGITQLGLTLSGSNLLTFDHFKLQDPESNPNQNNSYPINKIYSLGLNVTF